jgi:hypothetical protein
MTWLRKAQEHVCQDMLKLRARAVSRIYHSGRREWLVTSA